MCRWLLLVDITQSNLEGLKPQRTSGKQIPLAEARGNFNEPPTNPFQTAPGYDPVPHPLSIPSIETFSVKHRTCIHN